MTTNTNYTRAHSIGEREAAIPSEQYAWMIFSWSARTPPWHDASMAKSQHLTCRCIACDDDNSNNILNISYKQRTCTCDNILIIIIVTEYKQTICWFLCICMHSTPIVHLKPTIAPVVPQPLQRVRVRFGLRCVDGSVSWSWRQNTVHVTGNDGKMCNKRVLCKFVMCLVLF